MAATLQMVQGQQQKLHLTRQMQQSIEILRCDREELEKYLQEMSMENPFLEYSPAFFDRPSHELNQNLFKTGTISPDKGVGMSTVDEWLPDEKSMLAKIEAQIRLMSASSEAKETALVLAGMLDDEGYLREDAATLSHLFQRADERIEKAIQLLQSVEPAGIGATDLQECLLLQLGGVDVKEQNLVRQLICEHLEDIAQGRMDKIACALHISREAVQKGVASLKQLNPRPGMRLEKQRTSYVCPEVVVAKIGTCYQVTQSDDLSSMLTVNKRYREMLRTTDDPAVRDYLVRKLESVNWLRSCLGYRQTTLQQIAKMIVDRQQAFFEKGTIGLKPLTLSHVSEGVQMHESTISRAVRGAYMDTPRGVFAFKYFFASELVGGVSATSAKHVIKQIVEAENPKWPYSDADLVRALAERNIVLSRRTVAKYREQMNIASSPRRRRP